jgi:hypothetical protein
MTPQQLLLLMGSLMLGMAFAKKKQLSKTNILKLHYTPLGLALY